MRNTRSYTNRKEEGYVLVGILIVIALALLITTGMLSSSASQAKTRALVTTQANYYYEVESTLNSVVSWLQEHSQDMVGAFTEANFSNNFDLGSPSIGDNEGEHFEVPTLVKMKGTNDSVMLSNNTFFGEPAFPSVTSLASGQPFDAISEFQNADLGGANARVILVWARHTAGNYEPIFRIDVQTGNNPDRGVHSYSYAFSTLVTSDGSPGFYGRDWLNLQTPNNECQSYAWTNSGGVWNRGAPRSNCSVNSDGTLSTAAKVFGTANSLLPNGITFNPPSGNASGGVCEGAGCHTLALPVVNTWAGYCPTHGGDLNISVDTTLPSGGCWRDVTIANKKTLTLSDTSTPYYFRNISYGGNQAEIVFGPTIPVDQKIRIYAEQFDANGSNHLNGSKVVNSANAPHQVEFYYLGNSTLTLNGTVTMYGVIYAPNAQVDVLGNFNFYGGIMAKVLNVSGNAKLYYDEELGGNPVLTDMNYALRKTSQRYR